MKKYLLPWLIFSATGSFADSLFLNNVGSAPFSIKTTALNATQIDDQQIQAIYKYQKIINKAILASPSALDLRLVNVLKVASSQQIHDLADKIADNRPVGKDPLRPVSSIVAETAQRLNVKPNTTAYADLMGFAISLDRQYAALDISAAAKKPDLYLKELVKQRVAVCDNIIAFAFALLKQDPLFKNTIILPGTIRDDKNGDHAVLLIRIKKDSINNDYVLDSWLPYSYIDYPQLPDVNKALFLPVREYLTVLSKGVSPYQPRIDINGLINTWSLTLTQAEQDQSFYNNAWLKKQLDPTNSSQLKELANLLITYAK